MKFHFQIGNGVRHPDYGVGSIVCDTNDGYMVRFQGSPNLVIVTDAELTSEPSAGLMRLANRTLAMRSGQAAAAKRKAATKANASRQ